MATVQELIEMDPSLEVEGAIESLMMTLDRLQSAVHSSGLTEARPSPDEAIQAVLGMIEENAAEAEAEQAERDRKAAENAEADEEPEETGSIPAVDEWLASLADEDEA